MTNERTSNDQVYLAALAGLLHDVGKFAQRADWQRGKHTEVGAEFVRQYVPEQWREHLYPVMGHHDKPLQGRDTKVVALADRLSASERESTPVSQERQLVSILSLVGDAKQPKFWPLSPLALSKDAIFPGEAAPTQNEAVAYEQLWSGFVEMVQSLPSNDLPAYLEGLYYAMQKYTWCIPGAYYRSVPDVSLYDHSRTTAALAACFVGLDEAALDDLLRDSGQKTDVALLVGGDLSGVQDFIYTITAKGAAKGLRGRSFYLELLIEAVARYLLRRLKLPITNLLYTGGGHFYLLAPLDAQDKLDEIRADVSGKLLAHHSGDLYLALGQTPVTAADFDRERFGKKWRGVSEAMNKAKRQRFAELDADLLAEKIFGPLGQGGDEKRECQVCHYEGADVEIEREGDEEQERRICRLCQSLEELGTDLRDADYLLLGEVEPEETERAGYAKALRTFGMAVGFTAEDGRAILRLKDDVRRATLLATRDLEGNAREMADRISRQRGYPVAPGVRYTVNVTPHKGDNIATFEDLKTVSRGVKRLGVLRMDVDDLGDLLKWGMEGNATLSRVASFNFALSLFFEGWVGELCRWVNDAGTDKVYAIYSGGDDLFIVGAWDELPGLANTIRQNLKLFAAGRSDVHISGGLTLHGGKYPLYQAAHDAEDALGVAKDLVRPDEREHKKDAFNFLDLTIPWENFDSIREEQEQLVRLVTPKEKDGLGVDRALLRVLLKLYTRFTDAVRERGKPYWGPLMWQGAYTLKRMEGRCKDKEAKAEIKRIRESLKQEQFSYIETLGPAARWAELLIRKEQE
ncbi:MAG: type III-A CRISPR-associated protein Cas10/Csm1 [Anaerolineaceae bacterium 4572_32.1]|nr:MAG: type III-A CRISPR-associated protein Cas10/Csm1 [Anaerolineaceae bacterium 4572_32.1]HEY73858.1 type III-A CRISPR-associated protein Cas10/Csm1 [Thermoflexia bacterium]